MSSILQESRANSLPQALSLAGPSHFYKMSINTHILKRSIFHCCSTTIPGMSGDFGSFSYHHSWQLSSLPVYTISKCQSNPPKTTSWSSAFMGFRTPPNPRYDCRILEDRTKWLLKLESIFTTAISALFQNKTWVVRKNTWWHAHCAGWCIRTSKKKQRENNNGHLKNFDGQLPAFRVSRNIAT